MATNCLDQLINFPRVIENVTEDVKLVVEEEEGQDNDEGRKTKEEFRNQSNVPEKSVSKLLLTKQLFQRISPWFHQSAKRIHLDMERMPQKTSRHFERQRKCIWKRQKRVRS